MTRRPPCGEGKGCFATFPGSDDVERPEAGGFGLGDVERLAVGREADAVRREHRKGDLDDARAVRTRVIDAAMVALVRAVLAEVGEVEATLGVEDEIVRAAELPPLAGIVEQRDRAGCRVDALDPPPAIRRRLEGRAQQLAVVDPGEAAVVAAIERAVRAECQAVRPAAGCRDDRDGAVRSDAAHRAARDLDESDRAVRHGDGAFGKAETGGEDSWLRHGSLLKARRARRRSPR